jgi:hypothetical protein
MTVVEISPDTPIQGRPRRANLKQDGNTFSEPAQSTEQAAHIVPESSRRIWASRGIWLGVLAVVIGGAGQWLLSREDLRLAGVGLLVQGMALAAIAWSGLHDIPLLHLHIEWKAGVVWRRSLILRLAGIAASVLLLAGSFVAFQAQPNDFFGLQGALWLASMGLLLVSCVRWHSFRDELAIPWSRTEIAVFAAIIALSLIARLVWLDQIPWRVEGNEFTSFKESMNFYANPPTTSLFTTVFLSTGMPSMWFWPEGLIMRLMGPTLGGARYWPALIGALVVVPVYGLARIVWGRIAAIIAGFAVAISAVMVHYSRNTLPNIGDALWWAGCFYFLLRGLRSRRPSDFAMAGLLAGTSMYTYYATRLLPFVLAAFIAYMALFHFKAFREQIGHFALLAVGFLVGFGPLLIYFVRNPGMWGGRGESSLLIPLSIPTNWQGWVQDWNVLSHELWQNFLSLSIIPTKDNLYFAPFMFPAEVVIMLLGVGVLVWRWRQPASFLLLLWGLSVLFVSSMILSPTNPNPNFLHWAPAWPVFFLALALPPTLWLGALWRTGYRGWRVGCLIVGAGLAFMATANSYFYLVVYPTTVPTSASARALQGRFLEQVEPDTVVRFVGCCGFGYDYEYAGMMAAHVSVGEMPNPARNLPLVGDASHEQIFVVDHSQSQFLSLVQSYYPGGQVEQLRGPDGVSALYAYHLAPQQIISRYGVIAAVTLPDGTSRNVEKVGNVGQLPDVGDSRYPITVTWSGLFNVLQSGPVRLKVEGAGAKMWVMSRPYEADTPLMLDAGWVPFVVQAQLDGPGTPRLVKSENSGPEVEVETPSLWPQEANLGLAVRWNGTQVSERVDPFVAADSVRPAQDYWQAGDLPKEVAARLFQPLYLAPSLAHADNLIRWSGEVHSTGGNYTMELHSGGHGLLKVDGTELVTVCAPTGGGADASNQATLSPGWHSVELDLQVPGTGQGLYPGGLIWNWIPPGGVREIVPPTSLRYSATTMPAAPPSWPSVPSPSTCRP